VYHAHFGLDRAPFAETIHPAAYIALPSRDAALRRLHYAFEQGQGAGVLFGSPGVGKTMLSRRLASDRAAPSVHIDFPIVPAAELIGQLADEFGAPRASSVTMSGALRTLRTQLGAIRDGGQRAVVVIDEAQLIDDRAIFEAIRLLLNFTTDGSPDLFLLLVGCAEFLLELPRTLTDRLASHCLIGPFTEEETASYVRGKLAAAGATTPLFTPEALVTLHRAGEGLPRRLNRLADLALLIAYAKDLPIADEETVAIAARESAPALDAA
jgi:type II secretory pathway predicted ATPase ExeA